MWDKKNCLHGPKTPLKSQSVRPLPFQRVGMCQVLLILVALAYNHYKNRM